MKKMLLSLLFGLMIAIPSWSQVQNSYPYSNAQWIYLQRWTDYFQNPPVTWYSLLTLCACGDTVKYSKEYMKINAIGYGNSYQYYRKSNDSIYTNSFIPQQPNDFVYEVYSSTVGDDFTGYHDTVMQVWNTTLLNGQVKRTFDVEFHYNGQDTVIEDLGSVSNPWFHIGYTQISPNMTRLICFREGSEELYYIPHALLDTSVYTPCPVSQPVAMQEVKKDDVTISINSFTSLLTVSTKTSGPFTLELMNVQGSRIAREEFTGSTGSMNVAGYASGIYLYTFHTNGKTSSGRFVIP